MWALVFLALMIVAATALFNRFDRSPLKPAATPVSPGQTDQDRVSIDNNNKSDSAGSPTPVPSKPSPFVSPTTPVPTKTNLPTTTDEFWIYPGSRPISQTKFLSSDSVEAITSWYESKIKSQRLQINNHVKVSVNSVVKNLLSASSATQKISVEIISEPGLSDRVITLNIQGFR